MAIYLFRGTTRDWEGNPNARRFSFTYTSLDPLIATLFAVECRNHGAAVLAAVQRGVFPEIEPGPFDLGFQQLEQSVTLHVEPISFLRQAEVILDVDVALRHLADMGFPELPVRIASQSELQIALAESRDQGRRLSAEQRIRFAELMMEEIP